MILTHPALTILTTMAYLLTMLRSLLRRKQGHDRGAGEGVVTPPHSAGIYYLFGFFLFGVLFASWCSRRRLVVVRPSAGPPSRKNQSLACGCVLHALCVCVGTVFDALALALCFRRMFLVLSRCVVSVCCLGVFVSAPPN